MIAAWMLYAVLVSVLVAAAARGVEEVFRVARLPARWVWLGAFAVTLGLLAAAPLRTARDGLPARVALAAQPAREAQPRRTQAEPSLTASLLARARWTTQAAFRTAAGAGEGTRGWLLAGGWAALSLALVGAGASTLRRYRTARRGWPLHRVDDTPVRVAPAVGPAVLGVLRPEIVIPAWMLRTDADRRGLAVLHEREHLRGRDPLVLAAGCIAVALLPWNPAAWWMLRRLRLAVELDCDARVLRRGVPRQAYGLLLIDIAGRGPGVSLGVAAVAGSPSTLERRLVAMTSRFSRAAVVRAGVLGILGGAALFAACDTQVPTAAQIDALDVARAEAQASHWRLPAELMRVAINTRPRQEPKEGEELEITHSRRDAAGRVHVYGRRAAPADLARQDVRIATPRPDGTAAHASVSEALILVDGRPVTPAELHALSPDRIDSIEVLKGEAARRYPDPRAANGVILVTTKGASAPR